MNVDRLRDRHTRRCMSKGPRGLLPNPVPWTGRAAIPQTLKEQILLLFSNVEIIDSGKHVRLYTVLQKGAVSSEDILVHEFRITRPLGPWIIKYLAKHDAWRNLPLEKDKKVEEYLKRMEAAYAEDDVKEKLFFYNLRKDALYAYIDRKRNRVYARI